MGLLIPLDILIPIALVVIILIVVMWYLYSKNKKLYEKISFRKKRFALYKNGIENLKKSPQSPEKDFKALNKLARTFFKEYLNLNYSLTYLELERNFEKQNKQEYAKFCKLMSDFSYTGKKIEKEEIKQLVVLFEKILKEY